MINGHIMTLLTNYGALNWPPLDFLNAIYLECSLHKNDAALFQSSLFIVDMI